MARQIPLFASYITHKYNLVPFYCFLLVYSPNTPLVLCFYRFVLWLCFSRGLLFVTVFVFVPTVVFVFVFFLWREEGFVYWDFLVRVFPYCGFLCFCADVTDLVFCLLGGGVFYLHVWLFCFALPCFTLPCLTFGSGVAGNFLLSASSPGQAFGGGRGEGGGEVTFRLSSFVFLPANWTEPELPRLDEIK